MEPKAERLKLGLQAKQCFQWFWLKERQSGLLFIFQNSCKFADAHGALPRADTSSPQFCLTRTSPLLFRDKNRPFNRKVLGKPFEFKTYLLDYNKFDVTDKSYMWGEYHP